MYIAFEIKKPSLDFHPQFLSPRVMQWSEQIWLSSLESTMEFWQHQFEIFNRTTHLQNFSDLFREFFIRSFEENQFRAAMADHPWQALLLLEQMRERNLHGFVFRGDAIGERLLRSISWQSWWTCVKKIAEYFEQQKYRHFNPQSFKQASQRFQTSLERLNIKGGPWFLHELSFLALRRRYGSFLAYLWAWTFKPELAEASSLNFPWQAWRETRQLSVNRDLDHIVTRWDDLVIYLREDFEFLSQLCQKHDWQRIVSLEWRLKLAPYQLGLSDNPILKVPIHFRHPYALHKEPHSFATALLQAYYAFITQSKKASSLFEEENHTQIFINGWELVIDEAMKASPITQALFFDLKEDEKKLREIENKVQVPLYRYELCHDSSIQGSFQEMSKAKGTINLKEDDDAFDSVCALAQRRPLFIFSKAKTLDLKKSHSSLWKFCERSLTPWWSPPYENFLENPTISSVLACSDFYRYLDGEGKMLWVTRSGTAPPNSSSSSSGARREEFYVHGIFA